MNTDIEGVRQSNNNFCTRSYNYANKEVYAARKTLNGYISTTSDTELSLGQYAVTIPELGDIQIVARVLNDVHEMGPTGTVNTPARLQPHQPVVLIELAETGNYGILASYCPVIPNQTNKIQAITGNSDNQVPNDNDSTFGLAINRHQLEQGYRVNAFDTSGLSIDPLDLEKATFVHLLPGNFRFDGYNGERQETALGTLTTQKANEVSLVDGVNETKTDKTKAELFSFYHLTKFRLANSTKRLYEYRNGKIIPGTLLSQIRTFSGNFGETGKEIITFIDRMTNYLNIADTLIESVSDFISWFDKGIVEKVTDLISLIGLPTGLSIGNSFNLGLSYSDDFIRVSVDFNLGNRYVDAFLEGVANSLLSDFIGDTALGDLVADGLSLLGIDISGKDNPDKTLPANQLNPKIPTRDKSNKSLADIIDNLGGLIPGSFGDYLQSIKSVTSTIGLTRDGRIELNNPSGTYFNYLDYGNLNLNLQTSEGRLAAILTSYGLEYSPFIVESLNNFIKTNNPLHLLLCILPFLKLKEKVIISLFVFYVLESEASKNFLIQEFIVPELTNLNDNKYLIKLKNLKHGEILYLIDELEFNDLDFNNLVLNPEQEIQNLELDSQLKYYFEELMSGKILNFYRGCILLSSGYDITLDLELYGKLNKLVKEVHEYV